MCNCVRLGTDEQVNEFNSVLDEIALALDAKIEPQEIEKKLKQSKEPEPTKALEPKLQLLQRDEHIITDNSNIEEVKAMAKSDAKEYAEVYFNTFIDELKKLFAEKLEDFRKNKNRFFD